MVGCATAGAGAAGTGGAVVGTAGGGTEAGTLGGSAEVEEEEEVAVGFGGIPSINPRIPAGRPARPLSKAGTSPNRAGRTERAPPPATHWVRAPREVRRPPRAVRGSAPRDARSSGAPGPAVKLAAGIEQALVSGIGACI